MHGRKVRSLVLAMCAGSVCGVASGAEPTTLDPHRDGVVDIAHIYYNAATGERVVTLTGDSQTSGADTGDSELIWSMVGASQCLDAGFTTS